MHTKTEKMSRQKDPSSRDTEQKRGTKQTLYSQCGLSAQNPMARESVTAGIVDAQKHTRRLIMQNTKD